jgi:anti-sigma B factor antagonist
MTVFDLSSSTESDRVVVALSGECDLSVRDRVTSELMAALSRSSVVVVDLASLVFMDSSGVHALVTAHHRAERDGRRLYVINAAGVVAELLNLTGVDELLQPPSTDGGPPPSADGGPASSAQGA